LDITNEFVVPADPVETWKLLLDIKRIMPCVPGAELLEVIDGQTYKGKVSIRLGPVALAFVGTARFEELDEAARRARVLAKGSDAKGRGGANSVVQFRLEPVEDGTRVVVETNVSLSGSVAQYGRGTGVIQGVAAQLTAQFAQNLKAMLAHEQDDDEPVLVVAPIAPAAEPMPVVAAPPSIDAGSPTPVPATTSPASSSGIDAAFAAAARAEAAAVRVEAAVGRMEVIAARLEAAAATFKKASRPAMPPIQSKPISGLSLGFAVLRGMVGKLFSSKENV
jgi:uncharacterized protein